MDIIRRQKTGHNGMGNGNANGYVADRIRRKKTGHQGKGKGMQMDMLRIKSADKDGT